MEIREVEPPPGWKGHYYAYEYPPDYVKQHSKPQVLGAEQPEAPTHNPDQHVEDGQEVRLTEPKAGAKMAAGTQVRGSGSHGKRGIYGFYIIALSLALALALIAGLVGQQHATGAGNPRRSILLIIRSQMKALRDSPPLTMMRPSPLSTTLDVAISLCPYFVTGDNQLEAEPSGVSSDSTDSGTVLDSDILSCSPPPALMLLLPGTAFISTHHGSVPDQLPGNTDGVNCNLAWWMWDWGSRKQSGSSQLVSSPGREPLDTRLVAQTPPQLSPHDIQRVFAANTTVRFYARQLYGNMTCGVPWLWFGVGLHVHGMYGMPGTMFDAKSSTNEFTTATKLVDSCKMNVMSKLAAKMNTAWQWCSLLAAAVTLLAWLVSNIIKPHLSTVEALNKQRASGEAMPQPVNAISTPRKATGRLAAGSPAASPTPSKKYTRATMGCGNGASTPSRLARPHSAHLADRRHVRHLITWARSQRWVLWNRSSAAMTDNKTSTDPSSSTTNKTHIAADPDDNYLIKKARSTSSTTLQNRYAPTAATTKELAASLLDGPDVVVAHPLVHVSGAGTAVNNTADVTATPPTTTAPNASSGSNSIPGGEHRYRGGAAVVELNADQWQQMQEQQRPFSPRRSLTLSLRSTQTCSPVRPTSPNVALRSARTASSARMSRPTAAANAFVPVRTTGSYLLSERRSITNSFTNAYSTTPEVMHRITAAGTAFTSNQMAVPSELGAAWLGPTGQSLACGVIAIRASASVAEVPMDGAPPSTCAVPFLLCQSLSSVSRTASTLLGNRGGIYSRRCSNAELSLHGASEVADMGDEGAGCNPGHQPLGLRSGQLASIVSSSSCSGESVGEEGHRSASRSALLASIPQLISVSHRSSRYYGMKQQSVSLDALLRAPGSTGLDMMRTHHPSANTGGDADMAKHRSTCSSTAPSLQMVKCSSRNEISSIVEASSASSAASGSTRRNASSGASSPLVGRSREYLAQQVRHLKQQVRDLTRFAKNLRKGVNLKEDINRLQVVQAQDARAEVEGLQLRLGETQCALQDMTTKCEGLRNSMDMHIAEKLDVRDELAEKNVMVAGLIVLVAQLQTSLAANRYVAQKREAAAAVVEARLSQEVEWVKRLGTSLSAKESELRQLQKKGNEQRQEIEGLQGEQDTMQIFMTDAARLLGDKVVEVRALREELDQQAAQQAEALRTAGNKLFASNTAVCKLKAQLVDVQEALRATEEKNSGLPTIMDKMAAAELELRAQLGVHQAELANKDAQLANYVTQSAAKDALAAEHDARLAELQARLAELVGQNVELDGQVAAKDGEMAALHAAQAEEVRSLQTQKAGLQGMLDAANAEIGRCQAHSAEVLIALQADLATKNQELEQAGTRLVDAAAAHTEKTERHSREITRLRAACNGAQGQQQQQQRAAAGYPDTLHAALRRGFWDVPDSSRGY